MEIDRSKQPLCAVPCCGLPRSVTYALSHSKILSRTDGSGQTSYTYGTFVAPGADQLTSIMSPYGDIATVNYDVAGRPTSP
jgi:hypothetical protein